MLGAIIGDIIGSIYEFNNIKTIEFPLFSDNSGFTDDTVMTIAVAEWILTSDNCYNKDNLVNLMRKWGNKYINKGYGQRFLEWLLSNDPQPYNSWGNGSAMRVSPVGWAFDTLEETLNIATKTAEITHNHPEGIKGAQATAACIYLARTGQTKEYIKDYIIENFHYDLSKSCDEIRPGYTFKESCQGTVPQAIISFLDSSDFENSIRLGVSLGGDSDTLCCITGGISEAFYGRIDSYIWKEALDRLPDDLRIILNNFYKKFIFNKKEIK